jgi:hypothetical protein
MSKNDTWYGFLQAGDQSSPVVRDAKLETKNPKTIYLFNHVRGKLLEYSREVVEPKLRDLRPDDVPLNELKKAFKAARKVFVSDHANRRWENVAATKPVKPPVPTQEDELLEEIEEDIVDIADIVEKDDLTD